MRAFRLFCENITSLEAVRQQSKMAIVASLFREAVQVTPVADEVDALPAVSMVALPNELLQHIFKQACNSLEPRTAVYLSSANNELRTATEALLQQLRADHEAAAVLCRNLFKASVYVDPRLPEWILRQQGMICCRMLRDAKEVVWRREPSPQLLLPALSADDLATLGKLGSVLPALQMLTIAELPGAAGPDGVERLTEGLGAGALPAVRVLVFGSVHVGDAGAEAFATALGRGALPRLEGLFLISVAIGDAALVALAPALRRRPALVYLDLRKNLLGDEGLAALVAPPPTTTAVLAKLKLLFLNQTQITDVGCAALAAAFDRGVLPELKTILLIGIPASAAARATVDEALKSRATRAEL